MHKPSAVDASREHSPASPDQWTCDRSGHHNEVVLVGRLTVEPTVRELPSGDRLVTWRISITRAPEDRRPNQPVDPITCVSFQHQMAEATRDWRIGDNVEVRGQLRRRFWRSQNGSSSVVEVEAKVAHRLDHESIGEDVSIGDALAHQPS